MTARTHQPPRAVWRWLLAVVLVLAVAVSACSNGNSGTASPGTGDTATDSTAAGDGTAAEPAVRLVTLDAPDGPGASEYDQVKVLEHGAPDAKNVLVLVPGTSAGAAYFSPIATEIVKQLPGWQVWAVDRRENLLEDHTLLDRYLAGDATAQEAFDYYLGWLNDPSITDRFEPPTDESVAFARQWGMSVAVDDLSVVIREAKSLGGEVVLGGHSLGGTISVAYATWDFEGRAGAEDLSGLALIDGGSAAGTALTVDQTQTELAALETGSPFNDLVGLGLPWAAGVFNALGAGAVLVEPDEPSLVWDWPLFPAELRPPVAPTNAAQYGYALDTTTSPENLALVRMHIGHLAPSGDPRGWVDDELVPVARAARMFSGIDGIDGTAWYHPRRLTLDGRTVNGGVANPAQDLVGVRAIHGDALAFPIFALETTFGQGRVLNTARSLAAQSGLADDRLTLVDESTTLTHTDPMGVEPSQNPLLEAIVPYLEAIG